VWFGDRGTTGALGRITPSGSIIESTDGLPGGSSPRGLAAGPDGNMWFGDDGTKKAIGRLAPAPVVPGTGEQIGYCSVAGDRNPNTGTPYQPNTFLQLDAGQPATDPAYAGAVPANYLQGLGIGCFVPAGYTATSQKVGYGGPGDSGVYPYYSKPGG
jgi:hypothetical protein